MKKYLFPTLLSLIMSSPLVLADLATSEVNTAATPPTDAMTSDPAAQQVTTPATTEEATAPVAGEAAVAADPKAIDPKEAIKAKRVEHQSYMQAQKKKIRAAKTDDERRALIEGQREYMQEYMEEMHELMRAAQETEGQEDSADTMPPSRGYYNPDDAGDYGPQGPNGYGPWGNSGYYGQGPNWGGASPPYGYMPRMPGGNGPRSWNRGEFTGDGGNGRPCPQMEKRQNHYNEMQKRLEHIESLLEKLQPK